MSHCHCGEFDRPTIAPDEFGETCFHDTDKCEVPPVSVPIETVLRLTKARAEKAEAALEQAKKERDAAVEVAQGLSANFGEAQAAIQRVRELHAVLHVCDGVPVGDDPCHIMFGGKCAEAGKCKTCRQPAPCATLRALDGPDE